MNVFNSPKIMWAVIITLIVLISILHYSTPTMQWQYHLVYMQLYFIPILIAALQFGIKGGLHSVLTSPVQTETAPSKDDDKLDENDPIDLAILNALRAREEAEKAEAATKLPEVKDRRMAPRKTHELASFGRRAAIGKR